MFRSNFWKQRSIKSVCYLFTLSRCLFLKNGLTFDRRHCSGSLLSMKDFSKINDNVNTHHVSLLFRILISIWIELGHTPYTHLDKDFLKYPLLSILILSFSSSCRISLLRFLKIGICSSGSTTNTQIQNVVKDLLYLTFSVFIFFSNFISYSMNVLF